MHIIHLNEPFPYVIIDDFYDSQSLDKVWREVEYINNPNRMALANETNTYTPLVNGAREVKAVNNRAFLSAIFKEAKYSDIDFITNHTLHENYKEIWEYHPDWFFRTFHCVQTSILVSYYENSHYYKPHYDEAYMTCLTWIYKEPKAFDGGELSFSNYNLKIELKNNRSIVFPSQIQHEVSPVIMDKTAETEGLGRYCISTFMMPCRFR